MKSAILFWMIHNLQELYIPPFYSIFKFTPASISSKFAAGLIIKWIIGLKAYSSAVIFQFNHTNSNSTLKKDYKNSPAALTLPPLFER